MMSCCQARSATSEDADVIARIYNESIADRVATGVRHPIMVVEEAGEVLAFAATSEYRSRKMLRGRRRVLDIYRPRRAPPERREAGAGSVDPRIRPSRLLEIARAHLRREPVPASGSAARSVSGGSAPARNTANWTASGAAWRSWNGCFRKPRVV